LKKTIPTKKVESSSGIDLNSIINARQRLKKASPKDDDDKDNARLSENGALLLSTVLNRMKKFTCDSSGDEADIDDGEFD